jgi:hypothetical protein
MDPRTGLIAVAKTKTSAPCFGLNHGVPGRTLLTQLIRLLDGAASSSSSSFDGPNSLACSHSKLIMKL